MYILISSLDCGEKENSILSYRFSGALKLRKMDKRFEECESLRGEVEEEATSPAIGRILFPFGRKQSSLFLNQSLRVLSAQTLSCTST